MYISHKQIEEWFVIVDETRRQWAKSGFLRPVSEGGVFYTTNSVDEILFNGARNFPRPPTWNDLAEGRLRLLHSTEARQLLGGISQDALKRLIYTKKVAAVKFIRDWRVSEASARAYKLSIEPDDVYDRDKAARILSCSVKAVNDLVREGRLECRKGLPGHQLPITKDSLLRLLRELLPGWINEKFWLEEREEDDRPLLSMEEVLQHLGIVYETLHDLIAAKEIHTIRRFSGEHVKVSPVSVAAYIERHMRPLKKVEVARLYGVSNQAVYVWLATESVVCPIPDHHHPDGQLIPPCWIALLHQHASPGFQALHWYHYVKEGRANRIVGLDEMMARLQRTEEDVRWLAETGQIIGFRTPKGTWRFSQKAQKMAITRYGRNKRAGKRAG